MNFNIEELIERGEIDLSKPKVIKEVINKIELRIETLGLKKSHVAQNVDPPEDASTLSNFFSMKAQYVNTARIIKYCNYLDSVRT